jgi:hypothetical protein
LDPRNGIRVVAFWYLTVELVVPLSTLRKKTPRFPSRRRGFGRLHSGVLK